MDKQEIIEGNKIIAGFMGWTFEIIPNEYGGELIAYYEGKSRWRGERPDYLDEMMSSENGYAFHCDWNKLMPVVEKIEDCFDGSIMVRIHDKRCHIEMGTQYGITKKGENIEVPDCYNGFCNTKIEATWKACVQFIKWLNSQKQ